MARLIYLPDSNAWGRYFNGRSLRLFEKFTSTLPETIGLSSVVLQEIQYGYRYGNWGDERVARQDRVLDAFVVIPFEARAARVAGDLWAELARRGEKIGYYDIQIAATAIANDLIIVTHNVKHFSRIPGLRWEDWEVE